MRGEAPAPNLIQPKAVPYGAGIASPPVSCPGSSEARLAEMLDSIVQSSLENKATARLISHPPHDPGQQTGGNVPIPGHVHPVNLSLIPIPRKHQLENGDGYAQAEMSLK